MIYSKTVWILVYHLMQLNNRMPINNIEEPKIITMILNKQSNKRLIVSSIYWKIILKLNT